MTAWAKGLALVVAFLLASTAHAGDPALPALLVKTTQGTTDTWSVSLQVLVGMTALTLLPAILLLMTSFTRIMIVLGFLRQALGTAQSPPNQVLVGLSLFLTVFVMSPVLSRAWTDGVQPYLDGKVGAEQALPAGSAPFRTFMLDQTRDSDLQLFAKLSHSPGYVDKSEVPFVVVVSAFATSELKTAFQMGFLIYIPFVIIDLIVASVLMSMGMMMLSPMLISLPFKIMLFVLVDGWALLLGTLAGSFTV